MDKVESGYYGSVFIADTAQHFAPAGFEFWLIENQGGAVINNVQGNCANLGGQTLGVPPIAGRFSMIQLSDGAVVAYLKKMGLDS